MVVLTAGILTIVLHCEHLHLDLERRWGEYGSLACVARVMCAQGALRVNRFNPYEGFVASEGVGRDILITGRVDMNRAMDGATGKLSELMGRHSMTGQEQSVVTYHTVVMPKPGRPYLPFTFVLS
jgi:hypothetical protein